MIAKPASRTHSIDRFLTDFRAIERLLAVYILLHTCHILLHMIMRNQARTLFTTIKFLTHLKKINIVTWYTYIDDLSSVTSPAIEKFTSLFSHMTCVSLLLQKKRAANCERQNHEPQSFRVLYTDFRAKEILLTIYIFIF